MSRSHTSPLLINEPFIAFFPSLAMAVGVHEAIIVQSLHFWSNNAPVDEDGTPWVRMPYDVWLERMPYISDSTLRRVIYRLEELGVIVSARFNVDHAKWYRIDYDRLNSLFDDDPDPGSDDDDSGPDIDPAEGVLSDSADDLLNLSNIQGGQNDTQSGQNDQAITGQNDQAITGQNDQSNPGFAGQFDHPFLYKKKKRKKEKRSATEEALNATDVKLTGPAMEELQDRDVAARPMSHGRISTNRSRRTRPVNPSISHGRISGRSPAPEGRRGTPPAPPAPALPVHLGDPVKAERHRRMTIERRNEIDDWFEDLWRYWPGEERKHAARLALRALDPTPEQMDQMVASILAWRRSGRWDEQGGKFRPYPDNFISRRIWEDPPPAPRPTVDPYLSAVFGDQ